MDNRKLMKQLSQLKKLGKSRREIRLAAESWKSHFQTLIATIMSARTRDEVTIPTAKKLFKKYPNAKSLSQASLKEIQKIIKPVNFYLNKSKNISNCSKKLVSEYNGKVPIDFKKLISLPGVGRKTANVFLSETGEDAIGVDTHISYISRKLGWSKNTNPHKIEEDLKKIFPKQHWASLNPILVRFGKTYTSKKQKDKLLEQIKKVR